MRSPVHRALIRKPDSVSVTNVHLSTGACSSLITMTRSALEHKSLQLATKDQIFSQRRGQSVRPNCNASTRLRAPACKNTGLAFFSLRATWIKGQTVGMGPAQPMSGPKPRPTKLSPGAVQAAMKRLEVFRGRQQSMTIVPPSPTDKEVLKAIPKEMHSAKFAVHPTRAC